MKEEILDEEVEVPKKKSMIEKIDKYLIVVDLIGFVVIIAILLSLLIYELFFK